LPVKESGHSEAVICIICVFTNMENAAGVSTGDAV